MDSDVAVAVKLAFDVRYPLSARSGRPTQKHGMNSLEQLVERWRIAGLKLVAPAAEAEVRATFQAVGAKATADVIALYTAVGGMLQMDDELWRLWPLDEIKAENTELSSSGVLFSDYLIASWCFRLKAIADGTSAVLVDRFDGSAPTVIAHTLDEFVCSYVADATRLLDPASFG